MLVSLANQASCGTFQRRQVRPAGGRFTFCDIYLCELMSLAVAPLQAAPLREAFPHEAHDFTAWLSQHLDALGERIGLGLTLVQQEKDVGSFRLDLLCEDEAGDLVIVENQLEATDHRHLGQVLTYLVNLDAKTAIWVTAEPRPEHQRVVDWLNEATPADTAFYLVRVEAVRIGGSPYAPLFTKIVGPDSQAKEIGQEKKDFAERHQKNLSFWQGLAACAVERKASGRFTPSKQHWVTVRRIAGSEINLQILKDGAAVELYIDGGDAESNKSVFDALWLQQGSIEQAFGATFQWMRLDDRRASRVIWRTGDGSLSNPDSWPGLYDLLLDRLEHLDRAFRPYLLKLPVLPAPGA